MTSANEPQPAAEIYRARHGAYELAVWAGAAFEPPALNQPRSFAAPHQIIFVAPLAALSRDLDGALSLNLPGAPAPISVPIDGLAPETMIGVRWQRLGDWAATPPWLKKAWALLLLPLFGCGGLGSLWLLAGEGLWEGDLRLQRAAILAVLALAPALASRMAAGWKRWALLAAAGLFGLAAAKVLIG